MQMLSQDLTRIILTYLDTNILLRLPRKVPIVRREIMKRCPMEVILCLYPHIIQRCYAVSYEGWTVEFIQKHQIMEKHRLHYDFWYYLAEADMDVDIIRTYIDVISWNALSKCFRWDLTTLAEFETRIKWSALSINPHLTPDIIDRYQDRLDWGKLSYNFPFTCALVERYKDRIRWEQLSSNRQLSTEIIEQHADCIHWNRLSESFARPAWLLEHYPDRIDWNAFSCNFHLQVTDLERCEDKVDWAKVAKCTHDSGVVMKYCYNRVQANDCNWPMLASYSSLTLEFIEKFHYYFKWSLLSENQSLTLAIVRKHPNCWDWITLSSNPCLTLDMLEEFCNQLHFDSLSNNTCLITAFKQGEHERLFNFISRYQERWSWVRLSHLFLTQDALEVILDHPEWPWAFE